MAKKYYATEEYVDTALIESDSSKIFKMAEANQQLVTDDFGEIYWENKPIYKTNRTIHKIHSDNLRDLGEDNNHGRYQYTIRLNAVGHINPAPWNTVAYPLTVIFDGESYTIANRRLPVVVSNPTSKITLIHMYQHGNDAGVDIQFNEPGEHTIIYENGKMRYSNIGYEYMPEGYPKIEKQYENTKSYTPTGTLSSEGSTYFYSASNCVLEPESLYSVTINLTEYFINSETDDAGKIIVGNTTAPYTDPPVCLIYDPSTLETTFYWNESDGQNLSISISKIEDMLIPMDEKFLPEHNHAVSWNDLEDKPFGTKTEMVDIVPEQTLTNTTSDIIYCTDTIPVSLEANTTYTVVLNGVKCVITTDTNGGYGNTNFLSEYPFCIEGNRFYWPRVTEEEPEFEGIIFGETITLHIFQEQEVVQQIDIKYLPITDESDVAILATKAYVDELIGGIENGTY